MRTGFFALALGLLALRWLPALPPAWLLGVLALAGVASLRTRLYPVGCLLLGFCWACLSAQWALDDRLAPGLDGQTVWLEGRVSGLPSTAGGSVRFELVEATSRRGELPKTLRLSWFNGPQVSSGERWRLAVTLKRARGLVNPGGQDSEAWMLARRIGASGSVKDGQRLEQARDAWRDSVRRRLLAVDAQGREGALAALVLGDASGVSREDWEVLQATGTVHLLVISGTHIGLLAALIYGLVAGLARWGLWPRRWPWLPWACGLAFAAALGYGLLAGFQVPVQRACIMLGMVLLWRLRFRQLGVFWPLLLALNTVLLIEPLVSLQPGFWLSFAAVGVLLLVFAGRLGAWPWWRAWSRAQGLIAIGLLPVLLVLGLPVSVSGPLANLLAVPWISLAVLPTALSGSALLWLLPPLGEGLLWLAGGLINLLFAGLQLLAARLPAWAPPTLSPIAWGLMATGALLVLLPSGVPMRVLGWPLLLLALYPPVATLPANRAQVWQLDVGQGLAVLVRTQHHALLYDAGPRTPGLDAGERIVLPALRHLGVRRLDRMLISHAHLDHSGGAAAIRRGLPVGQVLAGEPAATRGAHACEAGVQWQWDGVTFTTWRWADARDSNSSSCVLLVEANGEQLLLGGDIDSAAERALVASGLALKSRWLQSPHHGSRTSSTRLLLDAVQPDGALVSRGHRNSFGHPHPQVVERYQALGIEIHDNALHGALKIELGAFADVWHERKRRRFWRDDVLPAE
ncbi:DNA internalization-related competence protein ComEC/Rec2 [Pseudomonas abieticivorans]|uniref:DNA internalization-related competence protein ComEC/Rec2 n=1 Tax=Pseudomonas abieticivorans TaxID=2931382 RepID=UPI0020BF4EED|nr:DNA internalization-related competence protein ComEC/Rec2 [Pseudomonas sp. PIA16]